VNKFSMSSSTARHSVGNAHSFVALRLTSFGLLTLGFFVMGFAVAGLIVFVPSSSGSDFDAESASLRWNQIQVIGTHNSYHLAPEAKILELISLTGRQVAQAIDYSHVPLAQQFSEYGIRQIELDLYADPDGGLYSKPIGKQLARVSEDDPRMPFDFQKVMTQPGIKVIHAPGFDYATTVPTLKAGLEEVVRWSAANREHLPILILLELKESASGPSGVKPLPFDEGMLEQIDQEIRDTVPAQQLITPDWVRGESESLRDAIVNRGWPKLEEVRGRLMFALDNTDSVRQRYLKKSDTLRDRMMFVSVDESHPAAAWMKLNDPINDFEKIQRCVRQGFLVRTRADTDTRQSRSNDTTMRDKAFASGAQFISTDYPVPDARWSEYRVCWPNNAVYRRNPVVDATSK
jgi:hypothetical protein